MLREFQGVTHLNSAKSKKNWGSMTIPSPRKPMKPPLQGSNFHIADRVLGRCPRLWDEDAPTARGGGMAVHVDGRPSNSGCGDVQVSGVRKWMSWRRGEISDPARRRRTVIPEPRATPWEIKRTALNSSPVRAASTRPDKRATLGPRKPLTPPLQGSNFHNADRVLGRCPRLWDDGAPTARGGGAGSF
jgi:hypothetical protein